MAPPLRLRTASRRCPCLPVMTWQTLCRRAAEDPSAFGVGGNRAITGSDPKFADGGATLPPGPALTVAKASHVHKARAPRRLPNWRDSLRRPRLNVRLRGSRRVLDRHSPYDWYGAFLGALRAPTRGHTARIEAFLTNHVLLPVCAAPVQSVSSRRVLPELVHPLYPRRSKRSLLLSEI